MALQPDERAKPDHIDAAKRLESNVRELETGTHSAYLPPAVTPVLIL